MVNPSGGLEVGRTLMSFHRDLSPLGKGSPPGRNGAWNALLYYDAIARM